MTDKSFRSARRSIGRYVIVLATIMWCGVSIARAGVTDLSLRTDGDALWLLKTDTAADKTATTEVRRRVDAMTGTWVESVRLNGRFVDAAAIDGRLAAVRDDGTWRLVWDGHAVDGPSPGGRVLRVAADGPALWAVVQADPPDGGLRLSRWSEADGWRTISGQMIGHERILALGVYGSRPSLALAFEDEIAFAYWDGRTWVRSSSGDAVAGRSAEFVSGSTRPLALVRQQDGQSSLWRVDGKPTMVRESINVSRPAGVAMVGPMLRLVTQRDGRLEQSTVDDFGRGQLIGPMRLADAGVVAPRPSELWNLIVLAVLTVFMLRSIRSPASLPNLPPGLRVAPLGRRAAAAVVDAVPLIGAAVWAFARFDGSAEHLREQSSRVFLPVFAGGLVYLTHVTVAEAWSGRSLGKRLFGLRVVTLDGERPRIESIFVRNLMRALDAFVLPAFVPLLSPGARRVGDLVAGTVVVADAGRINADRSSVS